MGNLVLNGQTVFEQVGTSRPTFGDGYPNGYAVPIQLLSNLVTYENSWVDYGNEWSPTIVRSFDNYVTINGIVTGGSNNTRVCTMPEGWKPYSNVLTIQMSEGNTFQRVDIRVDGVYDGELWVMADGIRAGTSWIALTMHYLAVSA